MCSPLKWHGGKGPLARRIVELMPPHVRYVEPYADSLAVLFAKNPEGVSEVVNDLHGELTNFWRVLKDPVSFAAFARRVNCVPFSEAEFDVIRETSSSIDRAERFFISIRQSFSALGKDFSPLSKARVRRGMNEQASAWLSAVDSLPAVHGRLRRVVVLNRPAIDVLWTQDSTKTLFYLDPPYLPETRASPDVYAHEMTREEHAELLNVIKQLTGRVILSGYANELYDVALADWRREDIPVVENTSRGAEKSARVETLWMNF